MARRPHGVRTASPIVLDGRLDEAAWATSPVSNSYTQVDPDEGRPASEETELRVLYDKAFLYVGVRLRDRGAVTGQPGRRDIGRFRRDRAQRLCALPCRCSSGGDALAGPTWRRADEPEL